MQRVKVMILAMMAVFALSAVVAATASATPEALNAEGKPTAVTFSGTSNKVTKLSILKSSLIVECATTNTEGELEATGKLGPFHLHFEGCKTNAGGECTGLGDAAKSILALGTLHLAANVVLSELPALTVGYILFLVEHTHFTCTVLGFSKLVLVLGEVLCKVTPINVLTATLTVKCEKGKENGDPLVTLYENDKNVAVTLTNALKASETDATEEMAAEEGEGVVNLTPQVKLDVQRLRLRQGRGVDVRRGSPALPSDWWSAR
jgi:hypothetical protein